MFKTSVIIVNFNDLHLLKNCLLSLLQSIESNIEIIVVDNASQDGSPGMVEHCFPEVHLICSPTNVGFGRANNLGALHARGKYLAFLNPDTIVKVGWLEALINILETDSKIGLVTSKILLLNDYEKINTCGNDIHITGLTLCRGVRQPADDYSQPETVSAISGAAFAIRRDLFEFLGGFDPFFFLYMEDTDLSLRARLLGYNCLYVPDSVVYHDYTLSFSPHKIFYQERNRYLMLLKVFHWCTLLALIPALLLAEVVTWGFVISHEPLRLSNKLRAYYWIIRHWKEIMQRRCVTQSNRHVADKEILALTRKHLSYEQAGCGWVAKAAQYMFDPLFALVYKLPLLITNH